MSLKYNINYGVLLAYNYKKSINPANWWMSEKLDGIRAIWDGDKLYYKSGKLINAPEFFLSKLPKNIALDGELYIDRGSFKKISSITSSLKPDIKEWGLIQYKIIDILTINKKFEDRMKKIKELDIENEIVQKITHIKIKNAEHLYQYLHHISNSGGEGLMLRKPNSFYEYKRSMILLKVKLFFDKEAVIIDKDYNCNNMLKNLSVRWIDSNIYFKVGNGLDKTEIFNNGEIIKIKYYEIDDVSGKPRFPIYIGKRNDLN